MKQGKKKISKEDFDELLLVLRARFEKNAKRHPGVAWTNVQTRLEESQKVQPEKLWSLREMERTGGEPDVIDYNKKTGEMVFYDCAPESPKERRSVCYDPEALESRKEHKPAHSAVGMAEEMGIELLTEEQYNQLQQHGRFDTKTSSWLKTPGEVRKLGGAIFGDWRYGRVFVYHNGVESYYAARGFRGLLRI